ncbi:MAG: hypothetical protein ACNYPE_02305 [Candidatus Azotimanducaceae bacterium WSBS_2022_MAG_OTU7]
MTDRKYSAPPFSLDAWKAEAEKQLKGKPLESLNRNTPEGIELKPLYTAEDLEVLEYTNSMPGLEPLSWPPGNHVRRSPLDDSPVCRLFNSGRVQRLLPSAAG